MELANRLELESTLAGKLSRLYGSHRRKIVAALKATSKAGEPPDPTKIPSSLWSQIESETEQQLAEEVLIIYLLAFTQTSKEHDLDWDRKSADSLAAAYSTSRAKDMAAKMTANSRERLEAGGDPLEIFGPDRAATVARSEVGVAQAYGSIESVKEFAGEVGGAATVDGGGGDQGGKKSPGKNRLPKDESGDDSDQGEGEKQPPPEKPKRLTLVAYWRHSHIRPKGHAGAGEKPCPICTPRLNKPESQWGGLVPGAGHPHCDCYVEFVALNNNNQPSAN